MLRPGKVEYELEYRPVSDSFQKFTSTSLDRVMEMRDEWRLNGLDEDWMTLKQIIHYDLNDDAEIA